MYSCLIRRPHFFLQMFVDSKNICLVKKKTLIFATLVAKQEFLYLSL